LTRIAVSKADRLVTRQDRGDANQTQGAVRDGVLVTKRPMSQLRVTEPQRPEAPQSLTNPRVNPW